mgnify:CR=1 FL=1
MGLKQLGFFSVVEAALGADMVSYREARELAEKGFLTSSCCPAFVSYIEKSFPTLRPFVSHNLSPMAEVARFIKGTDPDAKIIFIGPCTAKKQEFQREEVRPWIDCVLTFEELQAWFDSKDLDLPSLDEDVLDNASYFGRIFARSGGLTDAVKQALKEQGSDFIVNPSPATASRPAAWRCSRSRKTFSRRTSSRAWPAWAAASAARGASLTAPRTRARWTSTATRPTKRPSPPRWPSAPTTRRNKPGGRGVCTPRRRRLRLLAASPPPDFFDTLKNPRFPMKEGKRGFFCFHGFFGLIALPPARRAG